jgi:hypothetical protein
MAAHILFGRKPDGSEVHTPLHNGTPSDPITPSEVAKWFQKAAPRWVPPDARDLWIVALAYNLNVVRSLGRDSDQARRLLAAVDERLDRVKKALSTLAEDLPPLIDGAQRSGGGKRQEDMQQLLQCVQRTRAGLLPRRPRKRRAEWHEIAALLEYYARRHWSCPVGMGEDSPLVKLVGLAIARVCVVGEPERTVEAISQALKRRRKALKRQKGGTVEISEPRPMEGRDN